MRTVSGCFGFAAATREKAAAQWRSRLDKSRASLLIDRVQIFRLRRSRDKKKAATSAAAETVTFAPIVCVFIGWFGFEAISSDRLTHVKIARATRLDAVRILLHR
jgi:hypothetical protein